MSGQHLQGYSVARNRDVLVFRTAHFSEGRNSVLHSGIYNRELASLLSAGAVLAVCAALLITNTWGGVVPSGLFSFTGAIFTLAVLVVLFLFFRIAVFRERALVAAFKKQDDLVEIETPRLVGKKKTASAFGGCGISLLRRGGERWRTLTRSILCSGSLPCMALPYPGLAKRRSLSC